MIQYALHILTLIGIFAILSVSLNLVIGYTGLVSIAHAGFYGIGAYTAAIMAVKLGTPPFVNIGAGVAIATIAAFIVAWASQRLRGDYFVIATFAFQVVLFSVFKNWVAVTEGSMGIAGVPYLEIFVWRLDQTGEYLVLVFLITAAIFLASRMIVVSPFGRVLKAIREDTVFVQSLGKNVTRFKLAVVGFSAAAAALAGALYAHYVRFIDPTSFSVNESILLVAMVIIGGVGSLRGSALGATIMIAVPEALQFLGIPPGLAATSRRILFGLFLVVLMLYRPQGVCGTYTSLGRR